MPYFPPKQPEYNGLHHLMLLILSENDPLTTENLRPYLAGVSPEGKARDWFFDSFLSLPLGAPSGNHFLNDINLGTTMSGEGDFFAVPTPNPACEADWRAGLESALGSGGLFDRLDQAAVSIAEEIGPPPAPRNAIVTIPYPQPNQCAFRMGGDRINFSVVGQNLARASQQRLEACKWFVDETIARWEQLHPKHLHLLGFYWLYESLHYAWQVDDHWVLKELYRYIRERGYRLFWIPFYSSYNVNVLAVGREFYFDCAFLQPNHMFYTDIEGVDRAAEEACERGAGVEIEYIMRGEPNMRTMGQKHRRLRNYFDGGVRHGYMTESVCAYFCGLNDLHLMAASDEAAERAAYDDHFRFVQGTYEIAD